MASMLRLAALLLLLLGVASAQNYAFCTDGISATNFVDGEPIDVIVGQAPLFSTNPKIGQKFGLVNAYHSSLIFAQGSGDARRFWTLEFDNTAGSFLNGIVPKIVSNTSAVGGVSFHWSNDARYCLSEGLKWGREHWSKRYDVITSITSDQAKSAFKFVSAVNSTIPQYQLWHVTTTDFFGRPKKMLVKDITCADGVVWFLHYLKTALDVPVPSDFVLKATSVLWKARSIAPVNINDPVQLNKMWTFYRNLEDLTSGGKSIPGRLRDLWRFAFGHKFVYDTGAHVYYELLGFSSWFPWPHYVEYPLAGPVWMDAARPVSAAAIV